MHTTTNLKLGWAVAAVTALFSLKLVAAIGPGTAAVNPPAGGFAIDGNLQANITASGIGDWVPGPLNSGSGGNVLTAAGVPLIGATTFHLTDPYNSGTDDNFAGGLKYVDNPNTWKWVCNPVTAKNDINNGLLHFTHDANGHEWLIVAADRYSNNGDAYIDFEFLQTQMTVTGTCPGGGFSSAGPAGGRTVNDILLTLSLTKGGSSAGFQVQRWVADASVPLGYTYHDATSVVPANSVYAAVNTAAVPVSFGAFGSTTYDVNSFVEGAIDLTALLAAVINPCEHLTINTVFIKAKTSQSPTATITDFLAPQQLTFTLGVADAGPDQAKCSEGASTSFTVTGTATPSPGDAVSSTTWSVVLGSAVIDPAHVHDLTTGVSVSSASATLRFTVNTVKGCSVFDDVVLTVNSLPTASVNSAPICPGGSATLTATSNASNPSYSWSPGGATTASITVTPGSTTTYTVTVTDGVTHCSNSGSGTVTVNSLPTASVNSAPICAGGSATLTATSNASSPSYSWSPGGATTASITVTPGSTTTYTVTVTDGVTHCSNSGSGTVTVNSLPTASVNSAPICAGGSATLTATSNASSPSYSWSPGGATTASITVTPGSTTTYTVTVTDGVSHCSNSGSGTVTVNSLPTVSVNSAPICAGGSATLTATSNASSPSYSWSPGGATTASITVTPGSTTTYTVTVTDGVSHCSNSGSGTVTVNSLPTASVNSAPICPGGSATLTATSNASSPSYSWSPGGATTASITVTPGSTTTYTVTVTDGVTHCSNSGSGTVTVNSLPTASVNSAPICPGGSATLTATSNASNPSYSWSPGGATTASITVTPGSTTTYTVTVTDGVTHCSNSGSGTVTVNSLPTASVNSAPICAGGSATLTATSNASNPSYSWSPGGATTASITVTPGSTTTYTVTVTDGVTHCSNSGSGTVTVNPLPPCTIGITANGFKPTLHGPPGSYTYAWSAEADGTALDPSAFDPSATAQDPILTIPVGTTKATIHLTVTDSATSCTKTCDEDYFASQECNLSVSATPTPPTCNGGTDGSITASPLNQLDPVKYSINGKDFQDSPTFDHLSAGPYTVTAKDAGNCEASTTVTITQPDAIVAVATPTDAPCHGGNGSVSVTVSGGTPGYTVTVNGTQKSISASGGSASFDVPAGTYTATVTDAHQCPASADAVTVAEPNPLSAVATPTPAPCHGGNGSVSVTVSGGTPGYTVTVNGTQKSISASGGSASFDVPAGTYTATVTDAHQCPASADAVTVTEPDPLSAVATPTPAPCHGGNGSVSVTVSGGTAGYTVTVNGTQKSISASGGSASFDVPAGTYTATVTDAHQCPASADAVTVVEPNPLSAVATPTPAPCHGGNGSVSVTVSGGTPGYTVTVNGTQKSISASGGSASFDVPAGTYTATVTDAHQCPASADAVTVAEPNPLSAVATPTPAPCHGGNGSVSVTVSGGTPGYTVTVNGTQKSISASGGSASFTVPAGTYTATVTDAHKCPASADAVTVTEPDPLSAVATPTPAPCHGGNGSVSVTVSGGTAGYTVTVNGTQKSISASGGSASFTVPAGTYTATVTDAHQCPASADAVTVSEPDPLVASKTSINPTCSGNDGSIDLSVTGGTTPYTYVWADGPTTQDRSGLGAATYSVVVTDHDGCTTTATATLSSPFCGGRILPTGTTCADYKSGTVADELTVCYNIKSGKINNVAPGVFFYYTTITAQSSGALTVNITQTASDPAYLFSTQKDQIIVYDNNCNGVPSVGASSTLGQVSVTFNATAGAKYIISVKYSPGNVVGKPAHKGDTWTYGFQTVIGGATVDQSQHSLTLQGCN